MNSNSALTNLSVTQLRKAAEIKERIEALNQELIGLLTMATPESATINAPSNGNGRRRMSAAGRAKIGAAARARWAKVRAEKDGKSSSTLSKPAKGKRTMSASARAKIAAAARARWAKVRAAKSA